MRKYIDADLLISKELIPLTKRLDCCHPEQMEGVLKAMSKIDSAPAADVVEVVRCKDCKHLMFSDMYGECSQAHMGIVRPDDFCSYGERKDNSV